MTFDQRTLGELLEQIAARTPAPGGGTVAALTAALAAALARMVVRYGTSGSTDPLDALDHLGTLALRLVDADARAFEKLSELWRLDHDDPRRREEWAGAVTAAIAAPQGVLDASLETLRLLERLSETANANLRSDLAISALLAQAGAEAAAWNVRVNLPLLDDRAEAERLRIETERCLEEAGRLRNRIEDVCRTM